MKNSTISSNMSLDRLLDSAGDYKWIVLATPLIIYTIEKVYSLSNQAIENGYSLSLKANAEGIDFSLKP